MPLVRPERFVGSSDHRSALVLTQKFSFNFGVNVEGSQAESFDAAMMSLVELVQRNGWGSALRARIERLDLAFLVDAQHQRALRRIEIEADDVAHLVDEHRIAR